MMRRHGERMMVREVGTRSLPMVGMGVGRDRAHGTKAEDRGYMRLGVRGLRMMGWLQM